MRVLIASEPAECVIKKSRFLAEVFPVEDSREAKAKVKQLKESRRDARHVVHAFVIGKNGEVLGCSDDGEPAGTAGQPVLAVLKGSGITNVLVTVTRWFGGVLLGTGGLVKAYSQAAKAVLDSAETEQLIEKSAFSFDCAYEDHERILRSVTDLPVSFADTEYTDTVRLNGTVYKDAQEPFAARITELTKGASSVRFLNEQDL